MESFQGTLPELQDALSQLDTLQEIVVGFPEGD